MSDVKASGDKRLAMVHDLYLELGRVELLLEANAAPASVEREQTLRNRHSKLLRALDRLAA